MKENQRVDNKDVFFTDLDSTVIFSHRYEFQEKMVLAEWLHGKEQSYMTEKTYRFLKQSEWLNIVPVTTRTKEQYERVFLFQEDIRCKYAMVCNGGILLIDGEADQEWLSQTKAAAADELGEIDKAIACFYESEDKEHIYNVEGLFAYAVCEDPKRAECLLKERVNMELADILCNKRKVFCVPRSISKGRAVRRFRERFGIRQIVAAGDSDFDVPMLAAADIALVPKKIEQKVDNKRKIILNNCPIISNEICENLNRVRMKGLFL